MRPVGGGLPDRVGPTPVPGTAMADVAVGAAVQSAPPSPAPVGSIAFMAMAAAPGAGSGATFALVALLSPANKVGSVTGTVGAAGGPGGFIPPLVMGTSYGTAASCALGPVLLAVVAPAALAYTVAGVRRVAARPASPDTERAPVRERRDPHV